MKRLTLTTLLTALTAVGTASASVFVIDDLDPGYSTTGSWTSQSIVGRYGGDWQYQNAAAGADTATWSFTGLPAGRYVASVSTFAQANLSTSATYTMSDGFGSFTRNQQVATTHFDGDAGAAAGATFARVSSFGGYTPLTISDGTFSATLTDNDPALFLIADAFRLESVRPDVQRIYVIDNVDPGYAETGGGWNTWPGDIGDHGTDFRYSNGSTSDAITVSFTGLDAGLYRISTAWTAGGNRPSNVTLSYATVGSNGSTSYNQIPGAAADDVFEEATWQDMFSNVPVTSGSLTLTLVNTAGDGLLIADGFRLELIPEPSAAVLAVGGVLPFLRRRRRS